MLSGATLHNGCAGGVEYHKPPQLYPSLRLWDTQVLKIQEGFVLYPDPATTDNTYQPKVRADREPGTQDSGDSTEQALRRCPRRETGNELRWHDFSGT